LKIPLEILHKVTDLADHKLDFLCGLCRLGLAGWQILSTCGDFVPLYLARLLMLLRHSRSLLRYLQPRGFNNMD
jgi:hypothetical protein